MSLRIIKAGIADSIQDGGRKGFQYLGINPGGWMDAYSAQLANALLGKKVSAPVLELGFPAATILFERATVICLCGAHFSPTVNGLPVALNQPLFLPANSLLEFTYPEKGQWCYLSLIQELQAEKWLGSYSTHTRVSAGGFRGRTLRKNDQLLYAHPVNVDSAYATEVKILPWRESLPKEWTGQPLSFLKGKEWPWLTQEGKQAFGSGSFTVCRQSDRMGYRLSGPSLHLPRNESLVSSAVCAGTIQLLPNGQLIVLMSDHQTTGGYPRIGYISSADLPRLAQCAPGSLIQFKEIGLSEAEQKKRQLQKYLEQIRIACTFKMQNIVHAAL